MPFRYTGKWGSEYFYRGIRWLGPSNRIGQRPFRVVHFDDCLGFVQ